ncbi:MAG TPA: hypothetical protein DDW52_00460, partial [Planctomycetaceae bacterium]|nr:hypothetical protein [Planctomycetaceae bacterium]
LLAGLALLSNAGGFATDAAGQMPGVMSAGFMTPDAPMSMAFPGPAPGEVVYAGARGASCDTGSCGPGGMCSDPYSCGPGGCGLGGGNGPLRGMLGGACGTGACGMGGCGPGTGCLFNGCNPGLLGFLAPYSEGGRATPRWFDVYAGTLVLQREASLNGFFTTVQDPITGQFARDTLISRNTANGDEMRTSDLNLNKLRAGLETIVALQTGPGTSLEARYFGLNDWSDSRSLEADRSQPPTLFSAFSEFGTNPVNGFDDTDRSYTHTITYDSTIHNGEVNFRRAYAPAVDCFQGSFLAGLRYIDLNEKFRFATVGTNNNTFAFNQLRFSNFDVIARNRMFGVQIGGDLWLNVMPGLKMGVETKGGILGNQHEIEHVLVANSIASGFESLNGDEATLLTEFSATMLYRLSYSWTLRGSYNLLYLDNVALAPSNFNVRDYSNGVGGGAFTAARAPTIDVDGEIFYQGFSVGGEYTW